ncbi:MAG: hypothetical protein IJ575_08715 [Selenomonadaceae bacterium]|nr:hypothetical protein [Selenomonadaceae bacterium]
MQEVQELLRKISNRGAKYKSKGTIRAEILTMKRFEDFLETHKNRNYSVVFKNEDTDTEDVAYLIFTLHERNGKKSMTVLVNECAIKFQNLLFEVIDDIMNDRELH